ncbi:MAG: YicC family protein [Deltaproteobacteria bacterium]|jgi:uncharacterized protein (TIGR00255 family)|nr:YicC family protein [Deltaproteobacteria bacterium]
MLKSMTGFGTLSFKHEDFNLDLEIKTLNSRYLNIKVKSQIESTQLEFKIRNRLNSFFNRGKIECKIKCSVDKKSQVESSMARLQQISAALPGQKIASPTLSDFFLYQIAQIDNLGKGCEFPEENNQILLDKLELCLEQVNLSRLREGQKMQNALETSLEKLFDYQNQIKTLAVLEPSKLLDNLKKRISQLTEIELDSEKLEQEAAYLADKCDINEEIIRLESHLQNSIKLLKTKEPVGKNFNFIMQEILREINTIGSKTRSADISELVIAAKCEVEKIRELIANIA